MVSLALALVLAAGPAANVVPLKSVGKVELGMTKSQVRAILGTPGVDPSPFAKEYDQYFTKGISVAYGDDGLVEAIHIYSDIQGGYEKDIWKAFDLRLPSGVKWGAKYDDVIKIYGTPGAKGGLKDAPIPSRWIAYEGIMFDFTVADDRLFKANVSWYAPDGSDLEDEEEPEPTPRKKPARRPRSIDRPNR
jgi:hypothetical protein